MQEISGDIFFLENRSIDRNSWDDCIMSSNSSLIYARSFYLDHICPGWKALVGANYEWVLPITDRKKLCINYLYQPNFSQQLGVFAEPGITIPFRTIIEWLQKRFSFWEINWNYRTPVASIANEIRIQPSTNYIIDLSLSYDDITCNYSKHLLRNIRKSKSPTLSYRETHDYATCIALYKRLYSDRIPHVSETDYRAFNNICKFALDKSMLVCREIVNSNGEVLAIALLLRDEKRLYNLMPVTTEHGRKGLANHYLFDRILHEFSGTGLLFDFEGSDLPGVKYFYEGFGGINQPYYQLRYNNLPWFLKLIKR